jgi:KaiC/GvpD/RAD55 family RecA-like ATPase
MKKALSINDLQRRKYVTIPFTGAWFDAFGHPERTGVWFIWGGSGNGKSSFVMQLCAELTRYGKVIYNSLEEGYCLTFMQKIKKIEDTVDKKRFLVIQESISELSERLMRRRSADFVIIDSFQYSMLNYYNYLKFKELHADKLIVFTSHSEGKRPAGRSANSILFDATLKIWVEGFIATSLGRYIGKTGKYTIWEDGAWKFGKKEDEEDFDEEF